ncbi:copper chaperone PCu(A)C [Gilvimarinus chinensis]|uniref:copper chaperone PCu(A)C n=1 Tax=Gilvimarinus chinensis TaxID=396005 RepID=UPI00037B7865|nr:copper chaperone PCu(A)C [Gilvimarinus chinensis]
MPKPQTRARIFAVSLFLMGSGFFPLSAAAQSITVSDASMRLPVPGQSTSAAYFKIENRSDSAAVLQALACTCSKSAELHSHSSENGVMKMRREESLTLAAGESFTFASGGWHVMLKDVYKTVRSGDTVELTLSFAKREPVVVPVHVTSLFDEPDHQHHH